MAEIAVVVVEEALLYGDHKAQSTAAREIVHLTNKERHKLAEKGVISPLVSMLLHAQDYDAIEATLLGLLSLAFGSERNKIRIAKSGAIPLLIKLIQCQNQSLVDLAIAALLILSSCAPNKLSIVASGAIPVLTESLLENETTQAKLDIIVTLQNLSTCHQAIPSIICSGTVFSLLQLIDGSEKSSELVEKSMALLESIVSSSQTALSETANTSGAIQALVEAVEEGSPQCQEHAVGILLLICRSCRDRYRGMILREGAMPGLLQLSVDGTRRGKETAKSLLLLLRDCTGVGGSRRKGSKNELMEQVMGEIDRDEKAGTELRLVEEMIAKLRS